MKSGNIQVIPKVISVANAKAQFETFLRATGQLNDDDVLVDLVVGKTEKGISIDGKDEEVIPLKMYVKREEVESVKL